MAGMPGLAIGGGGGPDGQLLDEYDSLIDPFGRDGWDSPEPDIHIECLMPSGIVVPLDVLKDETLENIKQVGRWVVLFRGGGGSVVVMDLPSVVNMLTRWEVAGKE